MKNILFALSLLSVSALQAAQLPPKCEHFPGGFLTSEAHQIYRDTLNNFQISQQRLQQPVNDISRCVYLGSSEHVEKTALNSDTVLLVDRKLLPEFDRLKIRLDASQNHHLLIAMVSEVSPSAHERFIRQVDNSAMTMNYSGNGSNTTTDTPDEGGGLGASDIAYITLSALSFTLVGTMICGGCTCCILEQCSTLFRSHSAPMRDHSYAARNLHCGMSGGDGVDFAGFTLYQTLVNHHHRLMYVPVRVYVYVGSFLKYSRDKIQSMTMTLGVLIVTLTGVRLSQHYP